MPVEDLRELAERIPDILNMKPNEAQTNQWLVEPFIEALGYRISDPFQVERESVADYGGRQSYKVDYAIKSEGVAIIVIESKKASENLGGHLGQLKGYFGATAAKIAETGDKKGLIGILTNGLIYQFYTDQNESNILDSSPFWEIDLRNLNSKALDQLEKLERDRFNAADAVQGASELNYVNAIKERLASQLDEPDDDFVDLFGRKLHSGGNYMPAVRDRFRQTVRTAFREFIGERIRSGADMAVESMSTVHNSLPEDDSIDEKAVDSDLTEQSIDGRSGVETTDDELEGYQIVKAIVSEVADETKIQMNDTVNYCAVFLEKTTQPLCRFYFNSSRQKRIVLFDGGQRGSRIETSYNIGTPRDIHNYADQLRETARRYLED